MDLLHAGIERLDQGIGLISRDFSIEYANQSFLTLVGLNEEKIKKVTVKDIFTTNSTEFDTIEKSINLQQDLSIEYQSVMDNGKNQYMKLETKVLKKDTVFKGVMVLLTDKTDEGYESEKQATENSRWKIKFETVFHYAGDAMVLMDFSNPVPTFIDANGKMLNLVGYTKEEFLRLTVFDLLDSSFHHQAKNIYKKLKNQKNINVKATYLTKKKKIIPVDVTFSKYEVNGQTRLLTVVRDMSIQKEYEQQLLDALSFNQALIDSLQVGVTVIGNGVVKIHNQKTSEIFENYPNDKEDHEDDVNFWMRVVKNQFVNPGDLLDKAVKIMKQKKPIQNLEVELVNNRYVSLDYTPIQRNNHEFNHVWVSQDITNRIQYEQNILESNQIQHKLINSLHEGIILIKNNQIDLVSDNLYSLYPFEKDRNLERISVAEFQYLLNGLLKRPDSQLKQINDFVKQRRTVKNQELELENGTFIEYDFIPFETHDDSQARLWVLRDITKKKMMLTTLKKAQKEQEELSRAKNLLLSQISHDLKTPLNSIMGYLQLLNIDKNLDGKVKSKLSHIYQSAEILNNIIQDILDFSIIELGKIKVKKERVSVSDSMENSILVVKELAYRKKIKLVVEKPFQDLFILADSTRVNQVLINLLSNAIKYSREGGEVVLKSKVEGAKLTFNVIDNGIGMSKEQLSYIFNPFYRVKNQSENEGIGLGLPIVAKLIELMNGSYGAESRMGAGTTMWITLPLDSHCKDVDSLLATEKDENSPLTVLYIEDNQMNLEVMEAMLEEVMKVQLMVALSGKQGIELAVEKNPELIFLDLGLPDMEGMDVLRFLKQEKVTSNIPVVIVTANAMSEDKQHLMELGVSAYMEKPIDFQLLKNLMIKLKNDIEERRKF